MYNYFNEKNAASIIKGMFRRKGMYDHMKTTWIDEKGRQCACDGFRAYRLNVPIAGFPDAGLPVINLEKIFPQGMSEFKKIENAPTLDDLNRLYNDDKAHVMKTRKGEIYYDDDEPRGHYFFDGDGAPVVNLEYLRDMLKMFPDAEIYWKNAVSLLYFKSADGDGVLLPVRWMKERPANGRPIPAPRTKNKPAVPAFSLGQFAARYAM